MIELGHNVIHLCTVKAVFCTVTGYIYKQAGQLAVLIVQASPTCPQIQWQPFLYGWMAIYATLLLATGEDAGCESRAMQGWRFHFHFLLTKPLSQLLFTSLPHCRQGYNRPGVC